MILHFNNTTLEVQENDSSYRYRSLMVKPQMVLKFSLPQYIEFPVGTYCEYMGETYILNAPQNIKKNGTRNIEYTLNMGTMQDNMALYKMRNSVDKRLKFSMNAKPHEFIEEIVANLNERDGAGTWSVGTCIEGNERTIEFNHTNIDAVLSQVAETFETEWEIVGTTIHLHKVEYFKEAPLPLSYGRGNGFMPGVGRTTPSNELPIKRLYVQGGGRNIDRSKYNNAPNLLLPKSQSIGYDGTHFSDEDGYDTVIGHIYTSDANGYYIERMDKVSDAVKEDSIDCSDCYPSRIGVVSSVIAVKTENNFYDFIDNTIPASLNINDYIIEGETPTIIFQKGMLSGEKEFEFKYKHSERRFELVPQEIDGQTMPNATFIPAVGDTYAIFGIMLPDSYICDNTSKSGASWDMMREAVKHLWENENQKFTFMGTLQSLYAKRNWVNIGGKLIVGGYVHFSDAQFAQDGVDIRITGIKDYLTSPYAPTVEISNNISGQSLTSKLREIDSQEVIIEENKKDVLQFTKRRFRDAQETLSMLEDAFDNFSGSVNPVTIQTMAMLVGDESLQFRFVNSMTTPQQVECSITYDQANKKLHCPSGIIQHMTLGIDAVSPEHKASEYHFWAMEEYTSGRLDNPEVKYYLYAKVSKNTNVFSKNTTKATGRYYLSETAIRMDSSADTKNYYLLIGILNSEYDGERSFATLYGFTEILPGRITTDRIVSSDGSGYFDMAANAMKLGSVFDFNSQGDGKLRLRGTLVQSEGGTESNIGCYRGEYNNNYMYYNGDEVSFIYNDMTSTYRYIYPTPSKGHAPTETVYWQVIAAGSKGADGNSIKIKGTCHGHVAKANDLPSAPFSLISLYYLVDESRDVKRFSRKTWSSVITNDGDGYIMQDTGHLWVLGENGWNDVGVIRGDKGDKGDDGSPGQYTELRFAKNGSTTKPPSLNNTVLNPSGWDTSVPYVGPMEYLWVISAIKSGDGLSLVSNWSVPVRMTPYDGRDGANGESPVMVYRGHYDSGKIYYGNKNRLDCVKSGNGYFIARIDAGAFSSPAPPDTSKWNAFGASFESVATNLLLAEGANIGDWFISGGKIVSTLENGSRIELDARSKCIYVYSAQSNATYQSEPLSDIHIDINANKGTVETRAADNVAYLSPTGIFANRAATVCADPSSGMSHTASVVGLGFANANKKEYNDDDEEVVAGVYGRAYNRGTAPSYGGFFDELRANGLFLKQVRVVKSGEYLRDTHCIVIGVGSSQCNVFLPSSMRLGQTIFFKQWWTGSMRIFPIGGQKIYDDHTVNDYYDVGEGQMLIATFSKAFINGGEVEAWLVSRFKF